MSIPRFYLSAVDSQGWKADPLVLRGDEARHLGEVLRGEVGEKVVLFDGQGGESQAEVTKVTKEAVHLKSLGTSQSAPLKVRLILAQAIPKRKTMELIVQKATELGAAEIIPVLTERTIVKLEAERAEKKQEKWQRTAIEAAKQCGQNYVPELQAPMSMEEVLKKYSATDLKLLASLQSDAQHLKELLAQWSDMNSERDILEVLVFVGPEGDFTPAEIAMARGEGCQPLGLGPIILRAETAAIHCLSILGHELF